MIQNELNFVFSKHCTNIDKVLTQHEKSEDIQNPELGMDRTNHFSHLKFETHELYLLFCQFKDVTDIHMNRLKVFSDELDPTKFLMSIAEQIKSNHILNGIQVKFKIDDMEDLRTVIVNGKHRINYIIQMLVKNAMKRINTDQILNYDKLINIKCSIVSSQNINYPVFNEVVRLSQISDDESNSSLPNSNKANSERMYLVCEV
jgi:hypothetical protein